MSNGSLLGNYIFDFISTSVLIKSTDYPFISGFLYSVLLFFHLGNINDRTGDNTGFKTINCFGMILAAIIFSITKNMCQFSCLFFPVVVTTFKKVCDFFSLDLNDHSILIKIIFWKKISCRFKWNFLNLRKKALNSSGIVISTCICFITGFHSLCSLNIIMVFTSLILHLSSIWDFQIYCLESLNSDNQFLKILNRDGIKTIKFISLRDSWVTIRGAVLGLLVLIMGVKKLTFSMIMYGLTITTITYFFLLYIKIKYLSDLLKKVYK